MKMGFVEVNNRSVHYVSRAGGSQAIVFLHGGFGSSSQLWNMTIRSLPADYSSFAIDNFLKSDSPAAGYSVASFAERTAGFIRRLGLVRPVLVGHSMGGVVCQMMALEHPECVGGLVLVCTGASMTGNTLARDLLAKLRERGATPDNMREISRHWFHSVPRGFFDEYVELAAQAPADAMIAVQESLLALDLRSRLPDIKVPTLVVFGRHDAGRTFEHIERLLAGIPDSELATMADCGHTPMAETPAAFNDVLLSFLRRRFPSNQMSGV